MTVGEAINWIHSRRKFAKSPGQRRIRALLTRLGNPQDRLQYVHIAGTNGKGSTAAMLDRICREAGMRTGLFTSPFLLRFQERFQVCGQQISDNDLARITARVQRAEQACERAGGEAANEFEIVCAVGFCWFLEQKCDLVILEAGIGGLHDSTNVIPPPRCAIITAISLDHTAMLGSTTAEIAAQKAGILKPDATLVTPATQDASALPVLLDAAQRIGCPVHLAPTPDRAALSGTGTTFRLYGRDWTLSLLGAHQLENASCAVTAARLLGVADAAIDCGLRHVVWPGRLQLIDAHTLIDCGHNEAGIESLLAALGQYFPDRKWHFLVAMMRDKDHVTCLRRLAAAADRITATTLPMPRALEAEALAAEAAQVCPRVDWTATLCEALERPCAPDELRIVCGSVYLAGEALGYFSGAPRL